jgi:hypothetical protein
MAMPTTADRVPAHTAEHVNERIKREAHDRVRRLAAQPEAIGSRLKELDEEWDIERALEANAASFAFTGTVLAATVDRRWLMLPAVVTAFLFQHAVQGWCPPVPILRRLGYCTAREIDEERVALKALRGDFRSTEMGDADHDTQASRALRAARL